MLGYGLGRSYGDVCLNEGGTLLDTAQLNSLIEFDPLSGRVHCEAGVTIAELLRVFVPRGWFVPVTPGTKFVTVAGAVANDIHGKNHHRSGTFGSHVESLELLRSSGERLVCSADENRELFCATIGGLGLTGLILSVRLRLKPVAGPWIHAETIPFGCLEEFLDLSRQSDADWEYTVAWVDCVSSGRRAGRGIFLRGNHTNESGASALLDVSPKLNLFFDAPDFCVNPFTVRLFNEIYYRAHCRKKPQRVHYDPFFYPLDGIGQWNRLYGRRGFLQYQFVISEGRTPVMHAIFDRITRSAQGSFLAVLKHFGSRPSPGMMSFPQPGLTLALDFPNRGESILKLLDALDEMVLEAGGRVYPAKDARMPARHFQSFFPQWQAFSKWIDPSFSSSFWRRVSVRDGEIK